MVAPIFAPRSRAAQSLSAMAFHRGTPQPAEFVAYAQVLRKAFNERLQTMGDTSDVRDPSSTTHVEAWPVAARF